MVIGDSEVKNTNELAAEVAGLTPEWNEFRIVLVDPVGKRLSEEQVIPYAKISEHYDASRLLTPEQRIVPHTEVSVFNGAMTIGCPWQPIEARITADGHSYMRNCPVDRWAEMLAHIQGRVKTEFLAKGYVISELEASLNQKDDSPGDIDADRIMHYRAVID